MRQILSVSLPSQTIQFIKKRVKQQKFDSVSGYIKYLLELDNNLISEKELLKSIKEARQDYRKGKLKILKSLKDLM
ncbi:MAG: hypothetical protein U9O66_00930 [Patescibacteria group bacterium]|nr:hypothetical protein [Patescibacteria group bacterium]